MIPIKIISAAFNTILPTWNENIYPDLIKFRDLWNDIFFENVFHWLVITELFFFYKVI